MSVSRRLLAAGVPFSPADLSPELWLDASDTATITSSSGSVSQWNDKSSNGRNVTQGTGGAQPTTGSFTQNGLNVLSFDGGDSLAASTASHWTFLHNGSSYLFAGVFKVDSLGTTRALWANMQGTGTSVGTAFFLQSTNEFRHQVTNGSAVVVSNTAGTLTTSYHVVSLLADPDNATAADRSSFSVDGGTASANNTSTASPSSSAVLFRVGIRGTTVPFLGKIGELIFVSGANATETNRVLLRDYLNAKWDVY